ncbi:MAG: M20/M25/M40 family metallo-hydrolase, partial [Xanthomonadales bacterium]|nr:M20/M25/M40 family metallo-hydrolase [Xanthomonadales bacterium]NIX13819.1 M20/M25/M40 family metallo-hydrolase [Xanthomonadales bacterium]
MRARTFAIILAFALALGLGLDSPSARADEAEDLLRDIHRELVNINTAPSGGATTLEAATAMARRLTGAGMPESDVLVIGPTPEKSTLVARYRGDGTGGRPILMMAHLDVVEALPEDWSFDPFAHREEDGYFYGRGSIDNKAGAAVLVSNFIRLRNEGFEPSRDLIVYLSADEETDAVSTLWLLEHHPDLLEAEYALNSDAGYVQMVAGQATGFMVQAAEKMYGD